MRTLSTKTEKQLKCIVGLCNHTYENKTCLWNKVVDADDPRTKELSVLRKLILDEIDVHVKAKQSKHK